MAPPEVCLAPVRTSSEVGLSFYAQGLEALAAEPGTYPGQVYFSDGTRRWVAPEYLHAYGCSPGLYCPELGKAYMCPKGHYCPQGTAHPKSCSSMVSCPAGSAAPGFSAPGVLLVILLAIMLAAGAYFLDYALEMLTKKRAEAHDRAFKSRGVRRQLGEALLGNTGHVFLGLRRVPDPITVRFSDVDLTLRDGKEVLRGVHGTFRAGSMTAIMGPSGCGKSSLLNVLAGRAHYAERRGSVLYNGRRGEAATFRHVLGFVPQDDVVYGSLTVWENIWYSAQLRLPRKLSHERKMATAEDVISMLGLTHIASAVVGTVERRGISGGQRKRVSCGVEIAAAPKLLYMDEPTSGLDASTATTVLASLRSVAQLGVTIATVIHQPRAFVFFSFDEVALLTGGRMAYFGPTSGVVAYFESMAYGMPQNENPADWLLDVLSGTAEREPSEESPSVKPPAMSTEEFAEAWDERREEIADAAPPSLNRAQSMWRDVLGDLTPMNVHDAADPDSKSKKESRKEKKGKGDGPAVPMYSAQSVSELAPSALSVIGQFRPGMGRARRNQQAPPTAELQKSLQKSLSGITTLSKTAIASLFDVFEEADLDKNGRLDVTELAQYLSNKSEGAYNEDQVVAEMEKHCAFDGTLTREAFVIFVAELAGALRYVGTGRGEGDSRRPPSRQASRGVSVGQVTVKGDGEEEFNAAAEGAPDGAKARDLWRQASNAFGLQSHPGQISLKGVDCGPMGKLKLTWSTAPKPVHNEARRRMPLLVQTLAVLTLRAGVQWAREWPLKLYNGALVLVVAVVVGMMRDPERDPEATPAGLLLPTQSVAILGVVLALQTFNADRLVFAREAVSGVSVPAFCFAKIWMDLCDVSVLALVFGGMFYALSSPQTGPGDWLGAVWLLSFYAYGLGYCVSAVVPPNRAVVFGAALTVLLGSAFAGVDPVLEPGTVSDVLSHVAFSRWFVEANTVSEFRAWDSPTYDVRLLFLLGKHHHCGLSAMSCDDAALDTLTGDHLDDCTTERSLLALAVLGIIFRALAVAIFTAKRERI